MSNSSINQGLISKYYNPFFLELQKKQEEENQTIFGFDWGENATKTSEEIANALKKEKENRNSLFNFDLMDNLKNNEKVAKKEKETKEKAKLAEKLAQSGASTAALAEFKSSSIDKDLAYAQKQYEKQKAYLTENNKQTSVDDDLQISSKNKTENRFSGLQSQKAFGTCSLSDAKKGNYKTGGAGTFKGTRIAGAAESYKTFANNRKSWSEQKLDHAISERKTTLLEENQRKRSPKAEQISKTAGNIDGIVDETRGQQETVGTTTLSAQNSQITGATHSTGAGQALGQVSGGVENMESDFKSQQQDQSGEGIKKVLSGLSTEKANEQNALSEFDSAKAAATDYENYQENDAKASDKAAEEAIEEQGNQKNAQQDVENGAQKINQGNAMTNQGNQAVAQSAVEFANAQDQADEALQMRNEASRLQSEGLKELKEATKQNAKGVQLSRKGDQLIGVGQSLIYTGVPLTYSIFTVGIGVALIQSGLASIRKGKAKVNQGQNEVRKAEQNRSEGMKKFDQGTQKATESNEKQTQASKINKTAIDKNEQGQTMIANGAMLTDDGVSQKNAGQVNFQKAADATQRATSESNRLAQSAGENYANVQAQIKKTEQCLNTIITAQTNAEKLTGLQSEGDQFSGTGDAEQSDIKENQNAYSSSSAQLNGMSAGFNLSGEFGLSDAMKAHAYKKKRDDKKDENKDKKKDKNDIKTAQQEKGNTLGLGVKSQQRNQKQTRTQVVAKQPAKKVQSIFAAV